MPDSLEETVNRVAEASKYGTAEIAAFAAALAHVGESVQEAIDGMMAGFAELRKAAEGQMQTEVSRQRFRAKGKRRW